jgi:hypothetical protein
VVTGSSPARRTYIGLFLVTLATVMYEIVLTRIFSVTMWYHFAFVAISVAMFGMTVGALVVYLAPRLFPEAGVVPQMAWSALGFGVAVVVSFELHLREPLRLSLTPAGILAAIWGYGVLALPFALSGVTVCLALTRFPRHVGSLYAVDLAGAAAACVLVIGALEVTDGPTVVIAVAAVATLGAVCFSERGRRPARAALAATLVLACLALTNGALARAQAPLLALRWVKGIPEAPPLYERWNSFSRLTVFGDPTRPSKPHGWGLSSRTPADRSVRQLMLLIDAAAGTVLTGFDGRIEDVEHLKYDVTNVAHYLRQPARVLVIGTGGGRDILSALVFRQPEVVGVEINRAIIETVNERFAAFTGYLDHRPGVTFVNDEARSHLARRRDRFDILQISVIDTWAATGAGAFVLTEHSLYTVEAWRLFLDRLTPRGILAVSRFYVRDRPDEMYRLAALAGDTLRRRGARVPREHLVIVRQQERRDGRLAPVGVATLLASPSPFSAADLDRVRALATRMDFDIVLSARDAIDDTFATLTGERDPGAFLTRFPADIGAPTDDRPFFFHTLRLRDVFDRAIWGPGLPVDPVNMKAVSILGVLLLTVVGLTLLCVIVPLVVTSDRATLRGCGPLLVFFAAIGFGFMLVEISQMQRLMIFLGHPVYSLAVVLFAMLLSSGAGSLATGRLRAAGPRVAAPLALLVAVLVLFGVTTPGAIRGFAAGTTAVRVAVSVAIILPLGFLMGMAFPLGMRLASRAGSSLGPWLWGINGATSVCGSVVAMVIALGGGISASFWTGVACYAVATAAMLVVSRRDAPAGDT